MIDTLKGTLCIGADETGNLIGNEQKCISHIDEQIQHGTHVFDSNGNADVQI